MFSVSFLTILYISESTSLLFSFALNACSSFGGKNIKSGIFGRNKLINSSSLSVLKLSLKTLPNEPATKSASCIKGCSLSSDILYFSKKLF